MTTPAEVQRFTADKAPLAGNLARFTVEIPALEGHGSLAGTTADACVTTPDGTSTAIESDVTVGADAVTVTIEWAIPDDQASGWYTITGDTSGPLVSAFEVRVYVVARVVPAVPT